ncbi:condensation domain-containing protein [Micromonospora inyonensis]|uniref:Phosphopantetheine attachment site n=1 Tax=Micromonospora inyonensis TaxID=47866 RepID=A0A1C6S734_9ACTN|nr:condensation domain-containing protein [Micromonospora inyonensis]SCL25302.1 Phosphopantetheine attachment site [Micromonospora inyonensis]
MPPNTAGPAAARTLDALAQLWSTALRSEEIGLDDNFFALGGSSVQALEVAARIREDLGVDVPVDLLFSVPTIREAAHLVESAEPVESTGSSAAAPAGPPVASPAQERIWFAEQWQPGTAAYHMPWAIDISGPLDRAALLAAIDDLVARHAILRTGFGESRPEPRVLGGLRVPVREHDLRTVPEQSRRSVADNLLRDLARRPFDLSGPLLRADMLVVAPDSHILLLTQHHLTGDGWSTRLLVAELAQRYADHTAGRATPPAPEDPYARFAAWQQQAVCDGSFDADVAYWSEMLSGAPAQPVTVPATRSGPSGGRTREFELDASRIRTASRELAATPFTYLAAVTAALLHARTGQRDIVLGTTSANRERTEVAAVIGPVFNLLPLRLPVPVDATFASLVGAAQPVVLGAFAHQDAPFDLLVRRLVPERTLNAPPLFRVLVEFAPHVADADPAGTHWRAALVDTGAAKYDLAFTITDEGDRFGGRLTYDTGRYGESDAEEILTGWLDLLDRYAEDPRRLLSTPRTEPATPAVTAATAADEPVERLIAVLWSELLHRGVDSFDRTDSFFALGGTSLEIVRLMAWLRAEMRVSINPISLYEKPTVAALAAAVTAAEPAPGHARDLARVLLRLRAAGSDRWHPVGELP